MILSLDIEIRRTTIQRRTSDGVDFNRGWNDYVNGFGDIDGNYWMGLEAIHQLTTANDVSISINIETFEGEPFTLKLEMFSVGNAESKYAWNFSGYSQSSGRVQRSAFPSANRGMKFTTRDSDNDLNDDINCASDLFIGGWWYASCGAVSPNGNYEGDVTPTRSGIIVKYIDTSSSSTSATKAVKSIEMIVEYQ